MATTPQVPGASLAAPRGRRPEPFARSAPPPTRLRHRWAAPPRRPRVVAHRGASAHAPENTLAALRLAVEQGADVVELDVRRTRDGALVVLHDPTLTRTTDVREVFPGRSPWRVSDLSLAEVRRLDAGRWFAEEYAGEPVPTLAEALATVLPHAGLLVELKQPGRDPGMVSRTAAVLRSVATRMPGLWDHVVVQSFDVPAMKALSAEVPELTVGILGTPRRENLPALATWAGFVNPPARRLRSSYVEAVQEAGMGCLPWTVDRSRAMRRLLRIGVDGVISNRPDALAALID